MASPSPSSRSSVARSRSAPWAVGLGAALLMAPLGCGNSAAKVTPDAGSGSPSDAGRATDAGPTADAGSIADAGPSGSLVTSGTISFHLLLGVPGPDTPGDSMTLDGDRYTELIQSNFVAGAMYGHLIEKRSPGIQFNRDYLYGSLFGQVLQENIETELYTAGSTLIDASPLQQAVLGTGQGGPYQINNYAVDLVYGGYAPQGGSLINYVALQKNIGFSFANAATQHADATPPSFNDLYYGPVLTAYFHYNDYVALHEIGVVGGYLPQWEPAYDQALANFVNLPNSFLDVVLNVAYNQGYYGPLCSSYSTLGATATAQTVATVDDYDSVWGINDTYQQYPYQVRYYLDQLYDNPAPKTGAVPNNHVAVSMASLASTFSKVFQTLAYVDASSQYGFISDADASAAFGTGLTAAGVAANATLDLSNAHDRALIFTVLDGAISTLETNLGTDFTATTVTAL